jgi:hypothetical protein
MVDEVKKEEVKVESNEFSLETLFMKGRVTKTYPITKDFSVKFRSLIGEEAMQARGDKEVETGSRMYGISVLTINLAAISIDTLNKEAFSGDIKTRRERFLKLPAPLMDKIIEEHAKFYEEVQNLFPKESEKLAEEIEKK